MTDSGLPVRLCFGVPGGIVKGRRAGQTITIEDDSGGTGGYYIHIGPDQNGEQQGDIWLLPQDLHAWVERAG